MSEEEAIKLLKEDPDYSLSYYKRENAVDIVLKANGQLHSIIKEAINYIKKESWFCYKDDEKVIDRTPVERLLEILGDNDENI